MQIESMPNAYHTSFIGSQHSKKKNISQNSKTASAWTRSFEELKKGRLADEKVRKISKTNAI